MNISYRPGQGRYIPRSGHNLEGRVARWQVPENWTLVAEIPKTAVGKFDKKVLRARLADGELEVDQVSR